MLLGREACEGGFEGKEKLDGNTRKWDESWSITDEGKRIDSSLTGHKGREREAGKYPTTAPPPNKQIKETVSCHDKHRKVSSFFAAWLQH